MPVTCVPQPVVNHLPHYYFVAVVVVAVVVVVCFVLFCFLGVGGCLLLNIKPSLSQSAKLHHRMQLCKHPHPPSPPSLLCNPISFLVVAWSKVAPLLTATSQLSNRFNCVSTVIHQR